MTHDVVDAVVVADDLVAPPLDVVVTATLGVEPPTTALVEACCADEIVVDEPGDTDVCATLVVDLAGKIVAVVGRTAGDGNGVGGWPVGVQALSMMFV